MSKCLFLPYSKLQDLFDHLSHAGFRIIGPQVRDATIVYDDLTTAAQLPWGYRDNQAPGHYRLEKDNCPHAFAWVNGPQAIKPLLFKPQQSLWTVKRDDDGKLQFIPSKINEKPIAFIGARACDLVAMNIQDKVFMGKDYQDNAYKSRREQLFMVAVNCSNANINCFCASIGTGPKAQDSFDIALTEIEHGFVAEIGTAKGQQMLKPLKLVNVTSPQLNQAEQCHLNAANQQSKTMPDVDHRELLFNNLEHPRWDDVAARCLSCGNCTQVCPTCFCHAQEEKPSLDGQSSEQVKLWDSCFSQGHSYLHHQVIRPDTRTRYRQWLTHKLGSWHDQYGVSGCVGCGRCITWCPVGIDITEEMHALCEE